MPEPDTTPRHQRLWEVVKLTFKLGLTAFGGPAAHIAMLHDEVVERRKWLTDQHFLDMLGATNLIPGPNSTEMMIHTGYVRAGWPGLLAAGVSFITPAFLMVVGLSWAYVTYGATPAAEGLLYGIKPVVIAIVLKALWGLGKKALKGTLTTVTGLAVLGLYFVGLDTVLLLIGGGLLVMLIINGQRLLKKIGSEDDSAKMVVPLLGMSIPAGAAAIVPVTLGGIFLTFLKIGSVLYGSGYTLLAFLNADFVDRLDWLTTQQVVDAVAVGQFTPGPVFTTATFVGYILGAQQGLSLPVALLAAIGIFLPAFLFVGLSSPLIPHLRKSPWAGAFLDGVNATALGLMAAVTIQLGIAAYVDVVTVVLGIIAAVLVLRFNVNSTWLILGGAAVGLLQYLLF
jgi:chromate transporter